MTRGGGCLCVPTVTGITVNGALASTIETGAGLLLGLRTNESLPAGAKVSWFVDTALVATGEIGRAHV